MTFGLLGGSGAADETKFLTQNVTTVPNTTNTSSLPSTRRSSPGPVSATAPSSQSPPLISPSRENAPEGVKMALAYIETVVTLRSTSFFLLFYLLHLPPSFLSLSLSKPKAT